MRFANNTNILAFLRLIKETCEKFVIIWKVYYKWIIQRGIELKVVKLEFIYFI